MVSEARPYQVIDKSYMPMLVIRCALIFIAGLLITAGIFFLLMRQPIGPTYGDGFRMLAQLNRDIFYKSLIIYGSTVLVALGCIAGSIMLYSHRVAGPVYRLRLFAGRIAAGEVSARVTLRQTDVVHPLAVEMNRLNDNFRQTLTGISQEMAALEKQAELLEKSQDRRAALNEIKDGAERIVALIGKYKL